MKVFLVWDKAGRYMEHVGAYDEQHALKLAKTLFGLHAPWVQEEKSFAADHGCKDDWSIAMSAKLQQLRYAEVRTAENRTWRDKEYAA